MEMRRIVLAAAAALLASRVSIAQPTLDRAELTALSRSFLRDSGELPMGVDVTTVATDAKGKVKRNAQRHDAVRLSRLQQRDWQVLVPLDWGLVEYASSEG